MTSLFMRQSRTGLAARGLQYCCFSTASTCSSSHTIRTLSCSSNLTAFPSQQRRDSCPNASKVRRLTTSIPARLPPDDRGGKPNDGSYPTVYDDFKNITASDEAQLSIHSIGTSSFTLSDGLVVHTPIILLNKQVLLWDAPNLTSTPDKPVMPSGVGWQEWNDNVWKVFEVITPRPEIIVFGTGKTVLPAPAELKAYLNKLGIQVESHDTRNACSTYNLLIEEDRLVAAALIPTERKPTMRLAASAKGQAKLVSTQSQPQLLRYY